MFTLLNELNQIAESNQLDESWKTGIGAIILAAVTALSSGKAMAFDPRTAQGIDRERVQQVVSVSEQTYEEVKAEYMQRRGIQSEDQLTARDRNFIRAKAANLTAVKMKAGGQQQQEIQPEARQNAPQSHVRRTSMGNDW